VEESKYQPHNTRDCMSEKGASVGDWGKRGGRIVIDKVGVKKVELIGKGVADFGESEEGGGGDVMEA